MDETVIRRRRIRSDTEEISKQTTRAPELGSGVASSTIHSDSSQIEPRNAVTGKPCLAKAGNLSPNSDSSPVTPQVDISSSPASDGSINSIRSELLDDFYHSDLTQSDYSNDTHDWDGEGETISDDYWHFLGRFE